MAQPLDEATLMLRADESRSEERKGKEARMDSIFSRSTTAGGTRRFGRGVLPAICGTALTVAAVTGVAGVMARHADRQAGATPTDGPASAQAAVRPNSTAAVPGFCFFLVGSDAQAGDLESVLPADVSAPDYTVAVVRSPDDLVRVQAAAAEIDGAVIADLRSPDSNAAVVTTPRRIADDDIRVYLVDSQEQASDIAGGRLTPGHANL